MDDTRETNHLLVRLDERSRDHERRLTKVEQFCITRAEFNPVEKLVYGIAAAMLLAVVGALLRVVVAS